MKTKTKEMEKMEYEKKDTNKMSNEGKKTEWEN